MRYILLLILLLQGCSQILVPNKVYCPYIPILDINYTTKPDITLDYYIDANNKVSDLSNDSMNILLTNYGIHKYMVQSAYKEILYYREKITNNNKVCVHKDDK